MRIPRLKEKYQKEVSKKLLDEFKVGNFLDVPKVEKVVINAGIGDTQKNKESFEKIKNDIAAIAGQAPSIRKARVSVASFSLRKGAVVGLKVTLRGNKMYDFLDKLFSVVLPRLRDFRGVKRNSFDKDGNYTLGIVEHHVFPEIDISKSLPRGLEVTIVTKSNNVSQAFRLLELLGMPFEKQREGQNSQLI
ncbi:MAG: 50S ribosomal protein L5 [Candidatus Woesebacteria bacterium GW2011_GWA1_39_21]|uniref:Large ribosomal subunit protein uL5 n=1 Tax=Candidatus Woesebacteria bacterium GW2011_GWA1_39_21 TaxID=1618550 RepID=A0A0G0N843_9BACT|nr:MAG: 50S ribosomal protein L5 [Candidatus Woesebacteria bacterium GW2011_GWA1_39_21]